MKSDQPNTAEIGTGTGSTAPKEREEQSPVPYDYDYERLLDLVARIVNCAHRVETGLPERTPRGNAAVLRLAWQIEEDVKELRRILAERQRSIEGQRGRSSESDRVE